MKISFSLKPNNQRQKTKVKDPISCLNQVSAFYKAACGKKGQKSIIRSLSFFY